ncbi:MAG TPA: hypothetical protein VN046_10905 [Stenotrophobium sp.]|jgi:tetratricopeptide (TPR) repeat protein|nr:hypothetical protein [Stenotrophobium sp.]
MKSLPLLLVALILPVTAMAADRYATGSYDAPYLGESQYLADDGRDFSALVELLGLGMGTDISAMPEAYRWQLAETYLSFGMAEKAEPIYKSLAASTDDYLRLSREYLRLAEFYYDRGRLDQAAATLRDVKKSLPARLQLKWQDLESRVQLARGDYAGAAATLNHPETERDQTPYARYNLGVALINSGHVPQGRDVIDRIGRMRVATLDDLAIRDKANLTLGWNFLHDQLGGSAKAVLSRVRSKGPFSNRALLGVGWAELMQRGERQRHVDVDDEFNQGPFSQLSTLGVLLRPGFLDRNDLSRAGQPTFKLSGISSDKQKSMKRALAAWVELIHRDPMDPAVQEGWLAIPYALDNLGAHTEALQYYEQAIKNLETNRQRAEAAMVSIRQNRMVETIVRRDSDAESGWEWNLHDLPDAPETYYLQNLIAEHPFQEALKNYRDLRLMTRNIESWKQRLDALQKTFINQDRPEVDPQTLFQRATAGWTPPWPVPAVRLRAETALVPPGSYSASLVQGPPAAIDLKLAPAPRNFNGEMERIQALQARADALLPILSDLTSQQSKILQDMSIKELEGQKKTIEKYLVEARFALARLYDRQMKGQLNDK